MFHSMMKFLKGGGLQHILQKVLMRKKIYIDCKDFAIDASDEGLYHVFKWCLVGRIPCICPINGAPRFRRRVRIPGWAPHILSVAQERQVESYR